MDERPEELLADTLTLRRRARADRHAYWLPVLFFGLAIVASAPLYLQHATLQSGDPVLFTAQPSDTGVFYTITPDPGALYSISADPRVGSYWTAVLLAGALVTAWWYRRQGQRVGIEGRVGPALATATVVTIAFIVASLIQVTGMYLWPIQVRNFAALAVIAVGLLALARQERSRGLWVIAVLFTAAAALANLGDAQNTFSMVGWDRFVPSTPDDRYTQLPALVAPAAVLLVGGAVAGLRARRVR